MNVKHPVICFGEVLWDILPHGKEPGGAPMNVAYHLFKHHKDPALITAIGNDDDGAAIKDLFDQRGICTDYFFVDKAHSTGKVFATEGADHHMTYDIVKPVAWDFIPYSKEKEALVSPATYFVYGSLAARSATSRQTLLQLLEVASTKVFDINLRPPHFEKETLLTLLQKADILKMNEDELELVGKWFRNKTSKEEMVKAISLELDIPIIMVTLGAKGALLFMNNSFFYHPGYSVKVIDTVGSGDAFLAGILTQFINGVQPTEALDYAIRLGAFIAGKKGGCPLYDADEIGKADYLIYNS